MFPVTSGAQRLGLEHGSPRAAWAGLRPPADVDRLIFLESGFQF